MCQRTCCYLRYKLTLHQLLTCHRCKCSGTRLLSAGLAQQHRRTRQAVYPEHCSSALVSGDCAPVCRVDLHRCKCSGTRLLSAGLAQQHRRTRQAVYPKQCGSALVSGDCAPVCRVDLHRCKCHRCKCSGTRLLSAGLAQQHRRTRQAVYPEHCSSALVFGACAPVCRVDLHRCKCHRCKCSGTRLLSAGLAQQHRRTRQAVYPEHCSSALVSGDCAPVCRVDLHRCKCSGTRLLSAGLAQQHRRTRQAVYPKQCGSALVSGDCAPVCRVDLHRCKCHRCKCSGTRLLSAGLAQQHRRTRQAVYPEHCSSALVFGACAPVCRVDLHRCKCHRCKCSGTRLLSAGLAQQHRRTRQAVYPEHCSSALVSGDCAPVCRVDLHRCKCSGTRLLSAGLAQQHRRTRQAVYPKQCSSALVSGDCAPVCRVDLHRCKCHRCKCSGTRLLSAGLAQQHRRTRQAVYPKQCSSALVSGDCAPVCRVDLHRCKCHRCKCSGTRLLSAGLAQQHRRTRQAVYPEHCSSALVSGDCAPVCRVDLHRCKCHRCKCSGTRLLSAGLAQQHRRTRQAVYPKQCSSALVSGDCAPVCRVDLHRCKCHRCKCSGTRLLSAGFAQQHRRTRQAVYPKQCSSALVSGDCAPVCRVDLHRCKCSGTRLLSAGLAQQHRRTRQAVYPKQCSSALVSGDCAPVCRVDLHRCKCSGTRLLSAGLAQQHRRTRQAVYPEHCSSALVFGACAPVCRVDLHRCKCHRCKCSGTRLLSAGLAQQHRRTRQAVYPKQCSSALVSGDCAPVCRVDLHRCKCSGTRLLSAGLAQQHRRTRQAVYPKQCSSALVSGDCAPVCRVDLHRCKCHRCKCSGTRLLSAGLAQQHRRTRQAVYPEHCSSALVFGACAPVCRVDLHRCKCHRCKCSGTRLLSAGLAQQHRRTRQAVYPKQCSSALVSGDCAPVCRVDLHRCKCHRCKCSGTRLLLAGLAQQHRRTRQADYPKHCSSALVFGDCKSVCRVDLHRDKCHRCKCSGTRLLSAGLAQQHRRTRQAVYPKQCSSALVSGDCAPVCRVDLHRCKCHRCKCSGTRLLSAGLAQQHRRTRQAVYPEHCSSALVSGDCAPVCRVDLHRCKCSGTRLLSAGLAQQHRRTRQAVYPKQCSSALVSGDCAPVCRVDLHRCKCHRCKCSGTRLLSAGFAQQHRRTRQAVYPKQCSSALVSGDCAPVCRVDLHRCKCSGTRLLSAGLAQQHRRTRQAVYPKQCSSALVSGDCSPVCRVDLHRCKCSGTRLLSAGLAQQHRRTRQAVYPKHCSSALVFGACAPVCRVDLHRCKSSSTRLLSAGLAQQHRRTRQAVNPKSCSSALVFGDCKSVCSRDLHGCKCSGTRLLSAGLAQQHRRTRQAVYPKHCSSALVFGACAPVCRVDLHRCKCRRCKCSGTRLLSAGLAQQHRRTRQAVYPKQCSSALVSGDCAPVCRVDLHRCKCSGTRLLSAGLAQQHRRTRQAVYPKHCSSALVFGACAPLLEPPLAPELEQYRRDVIYTLSAEAESAPVSCTVADADIASQDRSVRVDVGFLLFLLPVLDSSHISSDTTSQQGSCPLVFAELHAELQ